MAEKRTTPDPAEGARRRKRQAPTIDLSATEVPVEAAAKEPQVTASEPQDEPPGQHPGQERPEGANKPDSAGDGRKGPPPDGQPWSAARQTVFAGFAGAAIMTAVLIALWLIGLVPARYAESSSTDPALIAGLNERVAKVETAIARLPGNDAGLADRIGAADNAMKSLGVALTALNKRSDEIATSAAQARARADAAEKAMTELRSSVRDLTKNTSAGLSAADVDIVQKRLAALEQAAKETTIDTAARLALSAAALRDAAASGAPFTAELNETKSLGADEKMLALLMPLAASGVPTAQALAQDLRALIPAMQKASGAQAPVNGFLERLQANAGKLVRIRPVDAPAGGDDASAVLARVEFAASRGDIDGAIADLGSLAAAVRAPAQDWIGKVRARQAALAAARELAAETARALGKR